VGGFTPALGWGFGKISLAAVLAGYNAVENIHVAYNAAEGENLVYVPNISDKYASGCKSNILNQSL